METMRNLTRVLLIAAVALGTARPQSANQELRVRDIKAQQPQETIVASAPCQRARDAPRGLIYKPYVIDPKSLVQDLSTLMENSDEAILAGLLDFATVISPSGESTATYYDARVIRSWKGPHRGGDTLTFGVPIGDVSCEPTSRFDGATFFVDPDDFGMPITGPYVFVLFLRQSRGNETQLVQGLRLAAGEGLQGIFAIQVPGPTYGSASELDCAGVRWSWQRCGAYMESSRSSVMVPYARDPLAKKYGGMPASEFLRKMQSVASGQRAAETSSSGKPQTQ